MIIEHNHGAFFARLNLNHYESVGLNLLLQLTYCISKLIHVRVCILTSSSRHTIVCTLPLGRGSSLSYKRKKFHTFMIYQYKSTTEANLG